jgi:hypothetical protein
MVEYYTLIATRPLVERGSLELELEMAREHL